MIFIRNRKDILILFVFAEHFGSGVKKRLVEGRVHLSSLSRLALILALRHFLSSEQFFCNFNVCSLLPRYDISVYFMRASHVSVLAFCF